MPRLQIEIAAIMLESSTGIIWLDSHGLAYDDPNITLDPFLYSMSK